MRRVQLYDSMQRTTRLFQPLVPPRVGMFVCGMTPYAEAHLGHGRFAVVFDVVARALRHWGYRVLYVQNVTDLDDKVIRRAAEIGVDPLELSARNFRSWRQLMEQMNITSVDHYPFATDYVPEIIEQVQQLETAGLAYVADDGSVYYEVAKFPAYGHLSGQKIESLRPGARLEIDRRKHAPEDFVLWKAATPGEPSWESPWGPGRPGWHIEDTAIAGRLLGTRYDLHGGGLDLIFPHHEAEIAQMEGASGRSPLVQYWMHNGLLLMGGEKMAKSTGNVFSLAEALEHFGSMPLRFYYLNAHYRSPLEYSAGESLEAAREAYERMRGPYERVARAMVSASVDGEDLPSAAASESERVVAQMDEFMANDFATREAVAALFGWTRTVLEFDARLTELSLGALETLAAPFEYAAKVLGLFVDVESRAVGPLDAIVRAAIAARTRARSRGDYAEADRIRAELEQAGVRLEDGASGTRWTLQSGGAPD
ncbi:MAG: cysteine--tRNA ligase [Thermoplasmata archaeon]